MAENYFFFIIFIYDHGYKLDGKILFSSDTTQQKNNYTLWSTSFIMVDWRMQKVCKDIVMYIHTMQKI